MAERHEALMLKIYTGLLGTLPGSSAVLVINLKKLIQTIRIGTFQTAHLDSEYT